MAPFIVPTVAFIIGADTGVGFQLARTLARDFSYHVFIGSPSYEEARTTASKLQPHSLFPVSAINIDLERDESITEAVDHFKSRRIKIDVLVINTGGDLFFAPDASLAARRLAFQNSFNSTSSSLAAACYHIVSLAHNFG
jgi:NAD(P)-dependent dehydrogenase (short-subunit alcohol dehydrogenase family)